jgi:hypothetical protein
MTVDGRIKSNKGKEGIANGKYEIGSGFSFNREEHSGFDPGYKMASVVF